MVNGKDASELVDEWNCVRISGWIGEWVCNWNKERMDRWWMDKEAM